MVLSNRIWKGDYQRIIRVGCQTNFELGSSKDNSSEVCFCIKLAK